MWTRRLLRAVGNKDDLYNPDVLRLLEKVGSNYSDGLALDKFDFNELRKRVPKEVVDRLISKDSILNHPDFAKFNTMADVTAHSHPLLPPSLSRPAFLLSERKATAKRMTLDFINTENALKSTREREFETSPVVSSDGYFVHMALVIARDPIWLLCDPNKVKMKTRLMKIKKNHNLLFKSDQSLVGVAGKSKSSSTEEQILKEAEASFKKGKDISQFREKGSTHFLRANPEQTDPRQIDFAGGYRTYLLLKDKLSEEWVFPEVQLYGSKTFSSHVADINRTILGNQMELHHLPAGSPCVDLIDFATQVVVPRPRTFAEDVFDLFFRRAQILFPEASESDIRLMLDKRHFMTQSTQPKTLEVKGKKVFHFRSLHVNGDFELSHDNYTDWAWVPRLHLNKYLSREKHARLVDSLL
mmetsp:Transcript_15476/g.28060  ORF Transcript_15476/g.28060 Transcript_15476/m.28060 type:complete len:413 (+) Transcript_15476:2299-3537(+)